MEIKLNLKRTVYYPLAVTKIRRFLHFRILQPEMHPCDRDVVNTLNKIK